MGIFTSLEKKSIIGKKQGFNSYRFFKDIIKDKYKENIDYKQEGEISPSGQNKKTYMLKPECFKKILMRNQKTDTYSNYYLFLEKILKYYSDYQNLKLKVENEKLQRSIVLKDDKIDELIKETKSQSLEIKELLKKSDKQLYEMEKTRQRNEIMNDKLNVVLEENEIISDQNNNITNKIDIVTKKLDIAVEDPGSLI